jgi:hypothetical protein
MIGKFRLSSALVISLAIFSNAYGLPGESIVLDPNTGDYQITYFGTGSPGNKRNKPLRQTIFVPATKINPVVWSTFRLSKGDVVDYKYRVKNGSSSRQSLISFIFDPVSDIISSTPLPKRRQDVAISDLQQFSKVSRAAINIPRNWDGIVWISESGGLRISWGWDLLNSPDAGLIAGSSQEGFGFSSKDIPGIGIAQFEGNAPVFGYPDGGPEGEISDQVEKLRQNDFVPRNAAVPTITVPDPFDPAILMGSIQTQMHTWIAMNLLDATFSAQLDRYFQSAISAYRLNQPSVGKQQIEALREMIKKEQPDMGRDEEHESDRSHEKNDDRQAPLINKLAARVLDFDLGYVTRRMDEDTHQRDKVERDAHEQDDGEHKRSSQIER